jgi:hypothetical protein
MDLKNKVIATLQKICAYKYTYVFIAILFLITLTGGVSRKTFKEETKSPERFIMLGSDRDFLTCVYNQLECYNEYAGSSREKIIERCKEITLCDLLK